MPITYRLAEKEDLKTIQELNNRLVRKEEEDYGYGLNLDWPFEEEGEKQILNRIDGGFAMIAFDGEKPVGYLFGGIIKAPQWRSSAVFAELETFFILPDYRSKGIGSKLIKEFVGWCREKKVQKLCVSPTAANEDAIRFYKRHGFRDYSVTLEQDL